MVEAVLREGGPKFAKMCKKNRKYECPGVHFGATWEYAEPAGEALDCCGSGLDVKVRSPSWVLS